VAEALHIHAAKQLIVPVLIMRTSLMASATPGAASQADGSSFSHVHVYQVESYLAGGRKAMLTVLMRILLPRCRWLTWER